MSLPDWGEEFAILLINTDVEAGRRVAEKIRGLIEKETFVIDNQEVHLTVSIGVTSMDDGTENYAEIYRFADRALYRAKTQGKRKLILLQNLIKMQRRSGLHNCRPNFLKISNKIP